MRIKFSFMLPFLLFSFISTVSVAQRDLGEALLLASPETIQADAELKSHMDFLAENAITEHCAVCHGTDLTGKTGVPNLVDFDWLWGVTGFEMTQSEAVFEIMQTILYGVRSQACPDSIKRYGACPDTRYSEMPAYSTLEMTDEQITGLVDYVYSLAEADHDAAAVENVSGLMEICVECHGEVGMGYKPFGGPDLTDDIWLFGISREQVLDVIANGRTESCPAWSTTLDAATIKALAVTIYNRSMGYKLTGNLSVPGSPFTLATIS